MVSPIRDIAIPISIATILAMVLLYALKQHLDGDTANILITLLGGK